MNVKHIKFKVAMPPKVVPVAGVRGFLTVPQGCKDLVWQLGKGPCGRYVEGLEVTITLAAVTIRQVSYKHDPGVIMARWHKIATTDQKDPEEYAKVQKAYEGNQSSREIKSFVYKLEDIHGRIEAIEAGSC